MMYGTEGQRAAIGSTRAELLRHILGFPCPVGEVANDPHQFYTGTGVVVEWSVMGDPRQSVEVCPSCARGLVS